MEFQPAQPESLKQDRTISEGVRESTPLTPFAIPAELRDEFVSSHLRPALRGCRGFRINEAESTVPQRLTDLIMDSQNRAMLWRVISDDAIFRPLNPGQRQALFAAISPYVISDYPENFPAIAALTDELVKTREYALYQRMGELLESQTFPAECIEKLSDPFLSQMTHNIRQDRHLQPWVRLFSEQGSAQLNEKFIDEISLRVYKGHRSSYDHLLTVVCNSRQSNAQHLIADSVIPSTVIVIQDPPTRSISGMLGNIVSETARMVPISALACMLLGGPNLLLTPVPYALAAGMGFMKGILRSRGAFTRTFEIPFEGESLGEPYLDFAEKVYGKLRERAASVPEARRIVERMEQESLYAGRLSSWRKAEEARASGQ